MINIGNRNIPTAFIRNIELKDNAVVITFYLRHKIEVKFRSKRLARIEYVKAINKCNKSKFLNSIVN